MTPQASKGAGEPPEAIAAEIERARKAAKMLFGDRYDLKVEPWRVVVRGLCVDWNCRPLVAVARMERDGCIPRNPLLLIAAAADVCNEQAQLAEERDRND